MPFAPMHFFLFNFDPRRRGAVDDVEPPCCHAEHRTRGAWRQDRTGQHIAAYEVIDVLRVCSVYLGIVYSGRLIVCCGGRVKRVKVTCMMLRACVMLETIVLWEFCMLLKKLCGAF